MIPSPALFSLRAVYRSKGRDLRLVGGCVRDMLLGETFKDIDLHTDATPAEQVEVYQQAGVAYYDTGAQHGTYTVVMDGVAYEITSLREDISTDGRHAEVAFTRDWTVDLARRDLTINAMSMSLEGLLEDPFGGEADLKAGRVRFVGRASDRVQEDYLRILRFLRFHGRYGRGPYDDEAQAAILAHKGGLKTISSERIWQELSKIMVHDSGPMMMRAIDFMGIDVRMAGTRVHPLFDAVHARTREPATLMVALLGDRAIDTGQRLRWSGADLSLARFLVETFRPFTTENYQRLVVLNRKPLGWVIELARLKGDMNAAEALWRWDIPVCPVTGSDLIERGLRTGPGLGGVLDTIRRRWVDSGYTLTADELMLPSYHGVGE